VPCERSEEVKVKDIELESDTFTHVDLLYQWVHEDANRYGGDSLKGVLEIAHDVGPEEFIRVVLYQ
jgi:hypothetical protein